MNNLNNIIAFVQILDLEINYNSYCYSAYFRLKGKKYSVLIVTWNFDKKEIGVQIKKERENDSWFFEYKIKDKDVIDYLQEIGVLVLKPDVDIPLMKIVKISRNAPYDDLDFIKYKMKIKSSEICNDIKNLKYNDDVSAEIMKRIKKFQKIKKINIVND